MSERSKALKPVSSASDIERFLQRSVSLPLVPDDRRGRLLFSLDATASRERTWDVASHLQCQMFSSTRAIGSLSVQLCYYGGYLKFKATPWLSNTESLTNAMARVRCLAGQTQINRVFSHALHETRKQRVQALVFIGDCVEEPIDTLCNLAGQLRLLGTPVFIFHEGNDRQAAQAFKKIAETSGGAYSPFNLASASVLEDLLSAVAAYSVGGISALERLPTAENKHIKLIAQQLRD